MTPSELDAILTQTLQDHRLTGSEKRALSEVLGDTVLDDHKVALYRSRAFAVARQALNSPDAVGVLAWLEDVNKLLQPKTQPTSSESNTEAYFSPGNECVNRVVRLLENARRQIDICVFTITDDRISRAIHEAHRRKVPIRLISDDEKSKDLGADIESFRGAGIAVRMDKNPLTHMHHKFALFDREKLLTGSYNWTRSAGEVNQENLIVTSDATLLGAFAQTFEQLWKDFA